MSEPTEPTEPAYPAELDDEDYSTLSECTPVMARAILVTILGRELDEMGAPNGVVTEFPELGLTLIVQRTGKTSHVEALTAARAEIERLAAKVAHLEAERADATGHLR